jgi:hypothetical protein
MGRPANRGPYSPKTRPTHGFPWVGLTPEDPAHGGLFGIFKHVILLLIFSMPALSLDISLYLDNMFCYNTSKNLSGIMSQAVYIVLPSLFSLVSEIPIQAAIVG